MSHAASLATIATMNENIVLSMLRRRPDGMSRVEIARETQLSAQTVSNVSRRLLERGLVREIGNRSPDGPGKPAVILQSDPDGAYAVGVHLDPGLITCVLLDFCGTPVAQSHHLPPSGVARDTMDVIAEAVDGLLKSSGRSLEDVLGIGVAAPGPIDTEEGALIRPRLAPGWAGLHLAQLLEEQFGRPSLLAKDVTAAVLAEHWVRPTTEHPHQAFLYWGAGVGVGLMLDGHVHEGASSNAGDVGHAIVDPDGPICECGRRGCFGELLRPFRMVLEGLRTGALPAPAGWDGGTDTRSALSAREVDQLFRMLWSAAELGNPAAVAVVERALRGAHLYVSNLVALLDVDQIVLGGPSWEPMRAIFLPALADLGTANGRTVHVRESAFGGEVAAVGAACLVFQSAFAPSGR